MTPELRQQLGEAATIESVEKLLAQHQDLLFASRDVDIICGVLDRINPEIDSKIAVLSNYTVNPLDKHIRAESARLGLTIDTYVGAYGQYVQEILDLSSGLQSFKPDIILLALSLEQLSPTAFYEFGEMSAKDRADEVSNILESIDGWVSAAKQNTHALLVLCNFDCAADQALGIADSKETYSEMEFYADLNIGILRAYRQDARLHILNLNGAVARFGQDRAYSQRMYHLAKMPWSSDFLSGIAAEFGHFLVAATGRAAKCLVLDLDNTLWGGIVGEDGPEKVRIGKGDPISEAYLSFQHALKALKQRGIILAICSKNNEADVLELFEIRNRMPLSLEDFSAKQINWDNKHQNLVRIAKELNIGTESLVFVDDNPVECAMVREMLPEVRTITLPSEPADFVACIRKLPYFEKLSITAEDKAKSIQYKDSARRQKDQRQFGDLNTFLESLATKLTIFPAELRHAERIHQLFAKTNQFNVTTKRYNPTDVESFLDTSSYDLWLAHVSDRYGDLGIIGLCLVESLDETTRIDSFILSCRAMGRGIETAFMNKVKQVYLINGRAAQLDADYIQTKKNQPASLFYEGQGFDLMLRPSPGHKVFRLTADDVEILSCPGIELR